ncbi:FidL-like protein [Pantoea sp. AS142]|uniref:FidL-like protein n=1 Tax=Pantoea sp. AS142 TaxID=3081292 RepID=UPI00301760E6
MINKIILTVFILLALPAGFYWYNYQHNQISLPFNCLYSTDYTFKDKGDIQTIHLKQDLIIRSANHAYFLLNGTAETSGKTYKINRTVLLDKGEVEHGSETIFRYTVNSVNKKADDDLPADIFDNLMSEYTLSSDVFELHVYPQGRETYLLGGTFSYLSVCLRE